MHGALKWKCVCCCMQPQQQQQLQREQQQQQQQIVSHPLWVIVANENEDSGSTRNRRSKSSSRSNAFKWLISLWPIVSAAHRNAHYAEQVKGCGMGGIQGWRDTLTNEIAGNAQNANEMCNHPGMQRNAKCVNILPQPTLSPTISRPLPCALHEWNVLRAVSVSVSALPPCLPCGMCDCFTNFAFIASDKIWYEN